MSKSKVEVEQDMIIWYLNMIDSWGRDRGIVLENAATAISQISKLKEEVAELEEGLVNENRLDVVDGIGDIIVVLIQVMRLTEISLLEALQKAYQDIRYREGKMYCGVFVKQTDLDLPGIVTALEKCYSPMEVKDAIELCKESFARSKQD